MGRGGLSALALVMASASASVYAAHITHFSPQGTVATIESVQATFNEPVIAFGDAQAPAPLRISCSDPALVGDGRWTDARNWTWVFRTPPGPGVQCTATLENSFQTLKGSALTGKATYTFSTGGPQVVSRQPYGDVIDEDQVFILQFNGAVDPASLIKHSYCSVQGLGEAVPVRLVDEQAQRKAVLESVYLSDSVGDASVQLVQCKRLLPADARVRLVVGKGVATPNGVASAKPHTFNFKVRPPFKASASCQRENAKADCLPVLPIVVRFNAPVAAEHAAKVRLDIGGEEVLPDADDQGDTQSLVQEVVFSGPFEPETEVKIQLPADLQDDAGRRLSNANQFPLTIRTAAYPALVKFASGTFGTVERFANVPPDGSEDEYPPAVPLTVRSVEAELLARDLKQPLGTVRDYVARDDAEILRWYASLQRLDGGLWTRQQIRRVLAGKEPGEGGKDTIDVRGYSLLRGRESIRTLKLPGASQADERPMEVIGIPLPEPGFHVLEVESPRLGKALLDSASPMYVRTGVLVTNLGVHLKQGRDDALVWVTTLDDGQVVSGADIRVLDCSGQLLAEGRTDDNGLWHHTEALAAPDYCDDTGLSGLYVSARIDEDHPLAHGKNDFAFVLSDWNRGMESWRFNVPTDTTPEPTVVAHTVLDRSLFRAGEKVSMKHFVRTETRDGLGLPSSDVLPDKLSIVHSGSGQSFEQELSWEQTPSGGLSAYSEFELGRSAKLGEYLVTLEREGNYTPPSGRFRVEEFKLPVLGGSLKISNDEAERVLVAPAALNADIQISYVAGGAAAGLPVSLSGVIRDKFVSFWGYEAYSFEAPQAPEPEERDGQRLFLDKMQMVLDDQGGTRARIDSLPAITRPSELRLEVGFSDPNGQVQTISQVVTAWPADVVAGIRSESWIQQGKPLGVDAIAVTPDGQAQAGVQMDVRAVAHKTYTVRQRLVGGFYSYQHETRSDDLGSVCKGTTDVRGSLHCDITIDRSGSIELIATATDERGRRSEAATRVWLTGTGELWFDAGNDDRIDIVPAQKNYKPGDTAEFQVRMPFRQATALVTVEREGVLHSEIVELDGKDPRVRIPVRPEWGPNVYVSVLVLRGRLHKVPWYSFFDWGWKQPAAWLNTYRNKEAYQPPTALIDLSKPAFRFGLTEIRVDDGRARLKVEVIPERQQYQVREEANVKLRVTTPDGAPAAHAQVAFAAVDEALLELASNGSWNVLEAMGQRRSYGVQTASGQTQVVGRRHYGRKALPAGGGGGKSATRELLDTLLLWAPRVQLDEHGMATVVVPLNDSISSFRLVALADHGAGSFGEGWASISATQDLQLISGLPALVRQGDSYLAQVTVRNTTARDMRVDVEASIPGQGEAKASLPPQTVELAAGKAKTLVWNVTAPQVNQADPNVELRWEVRAIEVDGGEASDRLAVTQMLAPTIPVTVHQAALHSVSEASPLTLEFSAPEGAQTADIGTVRGGLQITLQSTLAGGLPGVAQWFADYPYTCLEQLSSRAIGMRSVDQWNTLMQTLPDYLDDDGLARYFPGDGQGSEVLTAYLLSVSHEAKSLGLEFTIPESFRDAMRQGLVEFVQGRLMRQRWAPSSDLPLRKLLVLEALAREGALRPAMLDSIQIAPDQWPTSSVIDWFSILSRVADIPHRAERLNQVQQILRARMLNRGGELVFADRDEQWWLMRSSTTEMARLLSLVVEREAWKEAAPRLAQGLLGMQINGAWRTTTENLLSFLAIEKFSRVFETAPVNGQSRIDINGHTVGTIDWAAVSSNAEVSGTEKADKARPDGADEKQVLVGWPEAGQSVLDIHQRDQGKVWVWTRSLAAVPIVEPLVAGFEVRRKITPVVQRRSDVWSVGDIYRVTLTIDSRSPVVWAVVTDPVPAGATILGSGLGRDSAIASQGEAMPHGAWPSYIERRFGEYRAYYDFLPRGTSTVEYTVRLNTPGEFHLPPTYVEALYQPDVRGVVPAAGTIQVVPD